MSDTLLYCHVFVNYVNSLDNEVSAGSTMPRSCLLVGVGVFLLVWLSIQLVGALSTVKKAFGKILDVVEASTAGKTSPPVPPEIPGPRGLPYVGYLPFIGHLPHLDLARISQRYAGKPFRLTVGCRRFVVISRIEDLKELNRQFPLQLRGKPRTFTTEQMTLGAHNDLVQRWKRRRAYTEAGLKVLERTTVSSTVNSEVTNFTAELEKIASGGRPADIRHQVAMLVGRTMYRVAYGRLPDVATVADLSQLVDTMPDYTTMIGSLSWFDVLPLWRRIRASYFRRFVEFNQRAASFCRRAKQLCLAALEMETKQEQRSDDDEQTTSSLLDFFRGRMKKVTDAELAKLSLTEDILLDGLEDVIRAGTESASLIIKWFLLYSAAFPEVQRRMQEEIDNYLANRSRNKSAHCDGDDENNLTTEDLKHLAYCRASLMETFRFSSLNPFLKRELTHDITLPTGKEDLSNDETMEKDTYDAMAGSSSRGQNQGSEICLPGGTVLLYNSWAINNDRRHWDEPQLFKPERFLRPVQGGGKDGNSSTEMEFDESKMELFAPFGFGKRRCIGVDTGRLICLLTAVTVMKNFNVQLDPDCDSPPDLEPIFGIGLAPKSHRLLLTPRLHH